MVRYHNKTTKALQIVFSVLCFICAAVLAYFLVSIGIARGSEEGLAQGLGLAFLLIFSLVGGGIALGIFLIPWILLLIFCKKPWLSLAAYLTLILMFLACILACVIGG